MSCHAAYIVGQRLPKRRGCPAGWGRGRQRVQEEDRMSCQAKQLTSLINAFHKQEGARQDEVKGVKQGKKKIAWHAKSSS